MKYVLIAFAFMGFAFYELSGGSEFEPGQNSLTVFAEPNIVDSALQRPLPTEIVARADTSAAALTDVTPVRSVVEEPPQAPSGDLTLAALDAALPAPETGIAADAENSEPSNLASEPDFRFVDGSRVNMRGGPGTDYAVVGQLMQNDMIEVLADEGGGWLHVRVSATGEDGWMADWLVTAAD
ncbi:SH3 domain-containing protein [Marivita sp. S2033]|uniref:SH3 domain-containing protein n=1 Tax=Marivita sp. S2033 TaxID=3373187 RepID=UPI003981ABA9